jgi:uncharacterized pyridoxamine 5'-phosphate oxidase family protein
MSGQKQRRGIAMTPEEVDVFLAESKTCRVATVDGQGRPHVSPVWFVWQDSAVWFYSMVRSKRYAQLTRNPAVSAVVDAGEEYSQLRGIELAGEIEFVGEVPRTGEDVPGLDLVEKAFTSNYKGGGVMQYDRRHAWLKLTPGTIVSWDFRKVGA